MNLSDLIAIVGVLLLFGLSPEMAESLALLIFGYLGIITHYIRKWADKVERDEVFSIKKSIPSMILSTITTTVLIILRDEIASLYVFTKFSSFIVGYFGNSWFFGFIERKMNYQTPTNEQGNYSGSESDEPGQP
jgi:hypothetical protein